jgi:hypothetical protein
MGSLREFQDIAGKHGGVCLSEKYYGNNRKLLWQCKYGHKWGATPGNIKSGKWCAVCAGVQKHTIEEMHRLAALKIGKCLSNSYVNRRRPLLWKCEHGHTWEAPADSIISGRWCPKCGIKKRSDKQRGNIKEMRIIAEMRGGKCISEQYKNNNTRLLWQCVHGHTWQAVPSSIKNGTWCPECSSGLGERICRAYMEQLFNEKFPKARTTWLKSSEGAQLELDGYSTKLKMAFEHHGAQHFENINYFHKRENAFKKGQWLDDRKRQLCKEYGIKLIEILEVPRYIHLSELRNYIRQECLILGVQIPPNFETKTINLKDAYCISAQGKLNELQTIAENKGGKLLSEFYLGEKIRLKWMCKEGHVWDAFPYVIRRGSWCRKCATASVTDSQRGSIELFRNLAAARGGLCLSTKYVNVMTKLKWQCNKGHIWMAAPNNIRNGQWCPKCGIEKRAASQRSNIEVMQEVAAKRGGKCISKKYINSITKLRWVCSEGHIWEAKPSNVKFGQWCPICARLKRRNKETSNKKNSG